MYKYDSYPPYLDQGLIQTVSSPYSIEEFRIIRPSENKARPKLRVKYNLKRAVEPLQAAQRNWFGC